MSGYKKLFIYEKTYVQTQISEEEIKKLITLTCLRDI